METIGKRIKDLRKEAGMTQPELAKKLQVSNGIISYWENDINEPKSIYVKRLAEIFNVTTDYILGKEDEDPSIVYRIPAVSRTKDNTPGVKTIELTAEQYATLLAIVEQNQEK